jgi:hypothetical protein
MRDRAFRCGWVLEVRSLCLLRNPTPITALAFEHVKPAHGRQVQHARDVLRLLPAFQAERGHGVFNGVGLFHAAQNVGKPLRAS